MKKLGIVLILLFSYFVIPATFSVTCYNETPENVTVCQVNSTFLEENNQNLQYLKTVLSSTFKEENNNPLDYLKTVLSSTLKEINDQILAFLRIILPSTFIEAHYNLNYTLPGINITPGKIVIISDTAFIGDSVIKYKVIFPEYGAVTYKVFCYFNNSLADTKVYENVEPLSEITDYCIIPVLQEGTYNVTTKFYLEYQGNLTLLSEDTKEIIFNHEPFYVEIVKPENTAYQTLSIEVLYNFAVPPTNGITYILESKLVQDSNILWSYNDTLPVGVIGNYTYNLTFDSPGTFTLFATIYALYKNQTLVDKVFDNVTFIIQVVQQVGPKPTPITTVVVEEKPTITIEYNITENVTQIEQPQPQPAPQTVIEIIQQRPWLILVILIIIGLLVYYYYKS